MRGPIRRVILAALAVSGLASGLAGQALAATMQETVAKEAFLAIYGKPSESGSEPAGGGLARNFGFGENMLFQAGGGVGTALSITINSVALKAEESFIGGTLMSNTTGVDKPLGLTIQFADLQNASGPTGVGPAPTFSDTSDRPWIATICSEHSAAGKCKTDPLFATPAGSVKIEDVSINVFINKEANVIQGTVWGKWKDGTSTKAPCIALELPPAGATASQTLTGTQGAVLGKSITAISGEACLTSANNNYYAGKKPAIEIENK